MKVDNHYRFMIRLTSYKLKDVDLGLEEGQKKFTWLSKQMLWRECGMMNAQHE